jgi:hypothetical protein
MRRLAGWIGLNLLLHTLVIGVALAAGRGAASPTDRLLARLSDDLALIDGAWCWRGVCPGQIGIEAAARIIQPDGSVMVFDSGRQVWWKSTQDADYAVEIYGYQVQYTVNTILHRPPRQPATRLGDLLRYFGEPDLLWVDSNSATPTPTVCFRRTLCAELIENAPLSPHAAVDLIIVMPPSEAGMPLKTGWHGFANLGRCMVIYRRFTERCP